MDNGKIPSIFLGDKYLNNINNQNINSQMPNLNNNVTAENMDLNAVAQQAYNAEMVKHQPEVDAAQAKYLQAQIAAQQAQAAAAQLQGGNIQSSVSYSPEQIAQLQQQALAQLQQQAQAAQTQMPYPTAQEIHAAANPMPQAGWENNITSIKSMPQAGWENNIPNTSAAAQPQVSQPQVAPGITAGGFVMPAGAQYDTVCRIIAAEGGNRSPQEAVNIASTMINRARSGRWGGGNDIFKLATAKNQYVVYQTGRYKTAMLNPESQAAVNQLFATAAAGGPTAHNFQSFRSNGSKSYGGTILSPGGNRYK